MKKLLKIFFNRIISKLVLKYLWKIIVTDISNDKWRVIQQINETTILLKKINSSVKLQIDLNDDKNLNNFIKIDVIKNFFIKRNK